MAFKKIIGSIKRSQRKKKVINRILSTPQENQSVINIHRMDTRNVGDYYCAPHHYFEKLKNTSVDIFDYKKENQEIRNVFIEKTCKHSIIVGGGGLLNRSGFQRQMKLFESLTEKGKKIVLWGVGHNEKHPKTFGKVKNYNVDISKFGLVGTRDRSMPGEFVPCVSCLHPIFDKPHQETQEFGIVFHKDTLKKPKILRKFHNLPTSSNTTDLETLTTFIGASNKIVTDSYHVMYWSMLLGKKVVVIPNSSKFYDFKYQPVFTNFDEALNSFSKAETHSGLLQECREINLKFAEKVFDYLEM